MTHDEEFAVFDLADFHDLSNEKGDLYGLHLSPERSIMIWGLEKNRWRSFLFRKEIIPGMAIRAWPIIGWSGTSRSEISLPPKDALEKMKHAGLITENQRKRLARGKHHNAIDRIRNFTRFRLDVSWVGECPWTDTLCFGGEDGSYFRFGPTETGRKLSQFFQPATDTINAVAFAEEFIAVALGTRFLSGKAGIRRTVTLDFFPHSFIGGAHGIEASRYWRVPGPDRRSRSLDPGTYDNGQVDAQMAWHRDVPVQLLQAHSARRRPARGGVSPRPAEAMARRRFVSPGGSLRFRCTDHHLQGTTSSTFAR